MPQSIASPLVNIVIGKLGSEIWKELGLLRGVKKNIKKLQSTLSTIKDVLEDAEKKSINDKALCNWLRKLKDAAYDADDVLDEFQTEALRCRMENRDRMKGQVSDFFSSHNPIAFRRRIAQKIKEVLEKLNEVSEERKKFHLIEGSVSVPVPVKHEETHSFMIESEVYGRDDDKDKIVNLLLNENNDKDLSVLTIVGLGGIGKTTLAKLAYNDEKIKSIFDVRGWVCVSDDFDARGIARKVIQCIDKETKCDHLELDPLGQVLREKLGGKRFLLVMDDVWSEDQAKWESLESLLRCGKKGSKIIATTRSDRVAMVMHSALPYKLDLLSLNDCCKLFRERAFGAGRQEETPMLVEIGEKIVGKCGGLPLAAKALGSLMSLKRGKDAWLAVQISDIWRLHTDKDRILPSLRLSYYYLPSHLKNCFAYCSLFPKDYEFDRMGLIRLWIAEGFVQSSDGDMEDTGNNFFNDLLWRSFFQDVKKNNDGDIVSFKMHDLMHDLACDVAKDEFCSIEIPEEIKLPDNCRYLSLIEPIASSDVSDLPQQMKKLRSLIWLQKYRRGSLKLVNWDMSPLMHLRVLGLGKTRISMLPSTVCKLRYLRFLDLSYTDIVTLPTTISNLYNLSILILSGCLRLKELPSTFSRLTNLHTLDLSECYSLEKLPSSISHLHNLHTLNLSYCDRLEELPGDMSKMNNLRHLDIEGCDGLTEMPPGMGQLSNLQTLSFFTVGKEDGCHISELQHLNQLRGTLQIKNLHLVKNPREANEANVVAKRHLKRLELKYMVRYGEIAVEMEEEVIENLEPTRDIEELTIVGYVGIRLPNWIMSSATVPLSSKFRSLIDIYLKNLSRCECLPPLGQLPSLKRLYLYKMDGVRRIGEEFYGQAEAGGSQLLFPFPSLEDLSLEYMCNLEEWVVEAGEIGRERMFPSLTRLKIRDCPKLRVKRGLPVSVIHLTISGCNEDLLSAGSLSRLSRLSDLQIRDCEASSSSSSSWEGLQYLNALETLHIYDCPKLTCLPEGVIHGHIPSLRRLQIISNRNLKSLGGDLQQQQQQPPLLFTSLHHLEIEFCDALTALPEWLGCLTSLQSLSLYACPKLEMLPDGLQHLTALQSLSLSRCPNLEMLPDGLQRLTALQSLSIRRCPLLERRCERETGEDWHKISHIPDIEIYPTYTETSTGGVQPQEEEDSIA